MEQLKSIWQIDERITLEMASRKNSNDYVAELERLLKLYRSYLHDFTLDGKDSLYDGAYKEPIYKCTRELLKFARNYHCGDLLESNKYMRRFFKLTGNSIPFFSWFQIVSIAKDTLFFRSRPEIIHSREDIFHVPFESRCKIGTQRFSVPGYPCLYLASSVDCCIREVGQEKTVVSVSAFKNTEVIKLYDFRFFSNDLKESKDIVNILLSYPFKIASTIQTVKRGNIPFCEEYIIPQMILHGTIMQRHACNVDGIVFTSTEAIRNKVDNYNQYQNFVIPAKNIYNKGYCKHLCKLYTLTEPKPINVFDSMSMNRGSFENSIFQRVKPNNE